MKQKLSTRRRTSPQPPLDALLVAMPWGSTVFPSLSLGLLTAGARRRGFRVDAWHANLDFAATIGSEVFEWIAQDSALFALAEHLFACDLFGTRRLASDTFLRQARARLDPRVKSTLNLPMLRSLRDSIVPGYLDDCVARIVALRPRVVGFTCVFNQLLPSLALAARLKQALPEVVTIIGGGLVHGAMGEAIAETFQDTIDHVCIGEGDDVFPEFLEALRDGRDVATVAGVTTRGTIARRAPLITDLDALPIPDYDDYFADRTRLAAEGADLAPAHSLAYESARGCWWGQKHHCVFCGLNTEGITFRAKSPARVVHEITTLSARHRMTTLAAADNILVRDGYRTLLPQLAELGLDLRFFYEIKSNISRDEVGALARGGVTWLVPGVESLSDHVLGLIRKGVTTTQNVQLLKWLQEFGITPYWNLLLGFVGETDEDYAELARVTRIIEHLPAPTFGMNGANLADVHRFSPFFDQPEEHGIKGTRAAWYYRHLIPPDVLEGDRYAYFFERDIAEDAPYRRHGKRISALMDAWQLRKLRRSAMLGPGFVRIERDTGTSVATERVLEGMEALVFALTDSSTTVDAACRRAGELVPGSEEEARASLQALIEHDVVLRVGERVVNVIPLGRARSKDEYSAWVDRWILPLLLARAVRQSA